MKLSSQDRDRAGVFGWTRVGSALGLAAAVLLTGCKPKAAFEVLGTPELPPLQRYWEVPEFSFTERTGEMVTRDSLKGKIWVADFFYTTCPGPCPMMTSRLSAVQEKVSGKPDVRLVSISLDPEKDTPDVLKAYAERFNASPNWLFLTGDKTKIYDLAQKGFKLSAIEERNNPEPITHSTKLVLVDRDGWVRGFYEGVGEDQTARMVEDISSLEKEATK